MASSSSCSGNINITTSDDSESIANCDNYDGSILISSDASGTLEINGLTTLTGDLTAENATQLTSISADALSSVGGILSFWSCTALRTLQFDQLTDFNKLSLVTLPALQSLDIRTGASRSDVVEISDTGLTSLDDINLEAVGLLNVNNNRNLTSINIDTLQNVTTGVSMAANNPGLAVSFPNLVTAANLTAINVSSLSMPSLVEVPGSLGFYYCSVESISAPNLTEVGNDLSLVSNARLAKLDFSELQTIGGGFLIANNTELVTIDSLNSLETIGGALDFRGTFNNVTFDQLSDVRGGASVKSTTTDESLCDAFNTAASRGIIRGQMTCHINEDIESIGTVGSNSTSAPGSSDSTTDSDSGGSSESTSESGGNGLSGGAISGIVIGALVAVTAAILLWWFCRRKRKSRGQTTKSDMSEPKPGHSQLPLGGHHEEPELHGGTNQVSELPGRDAEKVRNAEMGSNSPIEIGDTSTSATLT